MHINSRVLLVFGIMGAVLYFLLSNKGQGGILSQFTGAMGGTLPSGAHAAPGQFAATPFGVYSGGTPFETGVAGLAAGLANIFHQQNQAQSAVPGGGTGGSSPGGVSLDSGGNFTSYAGATGATTYAGAIAAEQNPLNAPISVGRTVYVTPQGPAPPGQTVPTTGIAAPDITNITPDQGPIFSSSFFGNSSDAPAPPQLPTASLSFDSTTGSVNSFFDPTGASYGLPPTAPFAGDYLGAAAAAPAPVG